MKPTTVSSFLISFMRVVGSTVVGRYSAVLVGGDGGVGALDDSDVDTPGERMEDAEAYGTIGLVFRPRPPDTTPGQLAAEAMAVRVGGKLTPLAWRDLRINRKFPAPKPGTVALVGYGGGFLSFDDASADDGAGGKLSKGTFYLPYAFSGGSATKAHTLAFDPDTESIMLIHGDGYAVVLDKDNGITLRADASTWATLKPGEFSVVAAKISLNGNVAAGADTTTAIPFAGGPSMLPCASFFLSTP